MGRKETICYVAVSPEKDSGYDGDKPHKGNILGINGWKERRQVKVGGMNGAVS